MKFPSLTKLLLSAGLLFVAFPAAAQQSFSDLPPDHPVYQAAEYLKSVGVISGYDDGTFKPDRKVNRAEAIKIIVAPLVKQEQLDKVKDTFFQDIADEAWYLPYVEIARQNGIIDGPPKKTNFLGGNTVIKAEFLKMLELANGIDPQTSFSDISMPISSDVVNTDEWFYPYMRYGITSSMIMIGQDGMLHPGQELSRGDTALLLYRFIMYQEQRRTQALLSEAEGDIIVVLTMLEENNAPEANFAAARALLASRGANEKRPNEPIVQGAVKIAEAFHNLVLAYNLGNISDFNGVIEKAKNAWELAARAQELSPDLANIGEQVQVISSNMANSAREILNAQE